MDPMVKQILLKKPFTKWKREQQKSNLILHFDHQVLSGEVLPAWHTGGNLSPGAELLDQSGDGVMDKDNYAVNNNATLTNPSTDILRIARNGTNNPSAQQIILTVGQRVFVVGRARSDGNALPMIRSGGAGDIGWTGTNSTDWQNFNFEWTPTNTGLLLRAVASVGTEYVEFETTSFRPADPRNGDNDSMSIGIPTGKPLRYAFGGDGGSTAIDVESTEFDSSFDLTEFNERLWFQKDTWDTTERYFLSYIIDANNWIKMGGTTTDGQLVWEVKSDGTLQQITHESGAPDDWQMMDIVVEGGVMKAFLNGVQIGNDTALTGAVTGNFDTMTLWADTPTPTKSHLGSGTQVSHFDSFDELGMIDEYKRGSNR